MTQNNIQDIAQKIKDERTKRLAKVIYLSGKAYTETEVIDAIALAIKERAKQKESR